MLDQATHKKESSRPKRIKVIALRRDLEKVAQMVGVSWQLFKAENGPVGSSALWDQLGRTYHTLLVNHD